MRTSPERDKNIFGKQPEKQNLQPNIEDLLKKFGGKISVLAKPMSPEERAIVDEKMTILAQKSDELLEKHKEQIFLALTGDNKDQPEDYDYQLAA